MEDNLQNFERERVIIREKNNSPKSLWYIIIAVLVLVLLGWLGYSASWFRPQTTTTVVEETVPDLNTGFGQVSVNAAPIDSVFIESQETFPIGQTLVILGSLPNGCTYLNTPNQLRDGNVFYVTLDTRVEGDLCTQALVPYEERIELKVNNLPAGVYIVNVNGRELSFELNNNNVLDFNAGGDK
ncbi:MAG: hypothetical protein ACI870_000507 [Crocinitomicaceae bacterium]|jgi:hypothetical protein